MKEAKQIWQVIGPSVLLAVCVLAIVASVVGLVSFADYMDRNSPQPQAYSYSYSYSLDGYTHQETYSYAPEVKE